jgi:catechol 2,3-dioxygenase-like lactoylglutathione lyase family enzyme
MRLKYIYQGTSNYAADYRFYREQLGAKRVWEFAAFGANVAAFELEGQPQILLNDHTTTTRYIYVVDDITVSLGYLAAQGIEIDEIAEGPTGTCHLFTSPGGTLNAVMQETRPDHMVESFTEVVA